MTLWVPIIHPRWSGCMLVFVEDAASQLARLLATGDFDELIGSADTEDEDVAARLDWLLVERADLDVRARADAADQDTAWRVVDLLAERGDLDELRSRIDVGDEDAGRRLEDLLIRGAGPKKRNGCTASVWPQTDRSLMPEESSGLQPKT